MVLAVDLRTLGRVGAKCLPKDDVSFPYAFDDVLDGFLAEKGLGIGHSGDLKRIEVGEECCEVGLLGVF